MSQVGQTGSTQNTPVDYSSHSGKVSNDRSLDKVGSGSLDGQNIRFADQRAQNEVLAGQQLRAPELEHPDDVRPTALESASNNVRDVSELTEQAVTSTKSLIENIRNGTLTPEQQTRLQEHSETLKGTGNYLSNLHGQNVGTAEGKRSVLAGLGFNQSQLDSLLSLANPDDADNSLASLHGGQAALQGKKDVLSSLGFSESQIEALLSLANPDDEGNALASAHQAGLGPKATLQALGFSPVQAERLAALLNGQAAAAGSAEQRQLLSQMGFSDAEIDILLTSADPRALKQQNALIQTTNTQQVANLQAQAASISLYSNGSTASDAVLEQLADIFVVLELLHQMSVQSRRTARETRSMEYDAAKQEILKQADEMKKAAVNTLIAGVVSGAAKIAAGAISGAGALAGAKANASGADATAQSQAQSAALQQSMQRATAVSQMVSAGGDLAAAGFQYEAGMNQAKQKEHEAYQKTHDNAAQSESEWMQLQQDMVKTVQSKMDEIIRTWYETLKSTTRG